MTTVLTTGVRSSIIWTSITDLCGVTTTTRLRLPHHPPEGELGNNDLKKFAEEKITLASALSKPRNGKRSGQLGVKVQNTLWQPQSTSFTQTVQKSIFRTLPLLARSTICNNPIYVKLPLGSVSNTKDLRRGLRNGTAFQNCSCTEWRSR